MKALLVTVVLGFLGVTSALAQSRTAATAKAPNVVIIFADDLGYGDLGSYGHPTLKTPHLDQMAREGMRFTQFYVASSVCTPSRAALLTGRLPVRTGMHSSQTSGNVLYPNSTGGLPQTEVTLARALKSKQYQTALVGKWHLGHLPQFMPTSHGFDFFFGIPYSNDMQGGKKNLPPLPLYKDGKVLEKDPDQRQLTKRYTQEAIGFIQKNKDKPFFLYYANHAPHVPLYASEQFKGKSRRGLYGDVVEELDWSVGQLLQTLKDLKLDQNTLVVFTSDNGPWIGKNENGGSAGPLLKGKGTAYEGGFRVPFIAWWPGQIAPNQTNADIGTTLDLFPTVLQLAKVPLPANKVFDGTDMLPLLKGQPSQGKNLVYYYIKDKLCAVRKGPWKAVFSGDELYNQKAVIENPPLLFNLELDPSERNDVKAKHPKIVEDMRQEYEKQLANVVPVASQLEGTVEL